jgi:hypothetical protein
VSGFEDLQEERRLREIDGYNAIPNLEETTTGRTHDDGMGKKAFLNFSIQASYVQLQAQKSGERGEKLKQRQKTSTA